MNSNLLTTTAAAAYLKVARQTLAVWRLTGRGPAFCKIGRRVVYQKSELDSFIEKNIHASTTEYEGVS